MIAYFVAEPFRAEAQDDFFEEKSIERGAVLFANEQSEDVQRHLLAAVRELPRRRRRWRHRAVHHRERRPPVLHRPSETPIAEDYVDAERRTACRSACRGRRPTCSSRALRYTRAQITEIITYGRPGTPMQAWGVASGKGSLNEQSIERPRQLHREHQHHERQGQGTRRQGARRAPGAARRPRGVADGRRSGCARAEAELAEAEAGSPRRGRRCRTRTARRTPRSS